MHYPDPPQADQAVASDQNLKHFINKTFMDLMIRLALIAYLVVNCYQIFKPLIALILWSIILAVALYPLQQLLARHLGGRQGLTAVLLVVLILLGVMVPVSILATSFAGSTMEFVEHLQNKTLNVPAPLSSVAEWPVIGQRLHAIWSAAHTDPSGLLSQYVPAIGSVTKQALAQAASVGTSVLKLVVALLLSGVWMAYGSSSHAMTLAIARKIAGPHEGESLVQLSISTIRAVAQGVIGIACIQALLLGGGFVVAGIPGAGFLALLTLVFGILQLPALLISLPTIFYVFSSEGYGSMQILFAVYTMVAGSVDNVLKPLLLGRGVDAPMPIILLGALGGLATGGIIGLFLGPVMLALGYQLLMAWVFEGHKDTGLIQR